MIDPLAVIFVPGGTAAALVLFVGPLLVLRQWQWRRQARARNARLRCARCEATLAIDELHLFQGAHICLGCATTLRSRFRIAVPAALTVALGFGISSLSALVVSLTSGGPEFSWWLDGRWIPLLLPSVGLGAATVAFLHFSQRANRLRASAPWVELEPGEVRRWDLFRRRLTTVED
jgi:hypothetical protein